MKKILSVLAIALFAACSDRSTSSNGNGNGNGNDPGGNNSSGEAGQYYNIQNGGMCKEFLLIDEGILDDENEDGYIARYYVRYILTKTGKCPSQYSVSCPKSVTACTAYRVEFKFTEAEAGRCEEYSD